MSPISGNRLAHFCAMALLRFWASTEKSFCTVPSFNPERFGLPHHPTAITVGLPEQLLQAERAGSARGSFADRGNIRWLKAVCVG